jgi:UDP:flavonoid glycosyltransferase YjiC (YdhE family)
MKSKVTERKRILFLAEGATMAHFVRPLALAASLDSSEYDIHFYAPERFARFLAGKPFSIGTLDSMPGERFLDNISRGKPLFPQAVLRRYVQEERQLLRTLRPHLVIGDMRLSLPISARLENVPCAVMINAYWSPWAKKRSVMPELPLTRIIPPRWLGPLYRATEPLAFALHVAHINKVRREFGVPGLPLDMRRMYTDGDFVLYADVPEFIPTPGAPASHSYVGICDWAPPIAAPEWWQQMRDDPAPKVFVSLGSSGPLRVLPALLSALSQLPVSVVLSTSGRELPAPAQVKYKAGLLPFTETAALSSLVVSHGGSGGLYPALAAGTPVLGIPSNADQQLSTAALEESGAGLGVRVEEADVNRLTDALRRMLFSSLFSDAAKRWKAVFSQYDSGALFGAFLRRIRVGC